MRLLNISLKTLIKRWFFLLGLILILTTIIIYFYLARLSALKEDHIVPVAAVAPQQDFIPKINLEDHIANQARPIDDFQYPVRIGEIGPVNHLYSGPVRYPFACETERSGLGQPVVDNKHGWGIPIYQLDSAGMKTSHRVGYSKDCLIPTSIQYFYNRQGSDDFFPLTEANDDITKIELNGQQVDFIVRVEVGVINRFLYLIANIKGPEDELEIVDKSFWNGKLIYQFFGGVGIGRRQGKLKIPSILMRRRDILAAGYAIAHSTANRTSNHYNMWLAEEVMGRVKKQFIARFGAPQYTIGIGGSGGAIQQLLLAQNHPGLIDAAIALYAYPDMITQIIYAYDCELLEYYFDVIAKDNENWQDLEQRKSVQGLNAVSNFRNRFSLYYDMSRVIRGLWPPRAKGMTECVNGWRGLTPLTNNPNFTHKIKYYDETVLKQVRWSYWEDLRHIFGENESGYANRAWDNVGVQYGLEALKAQKISVEEFLHLNTHIGGWKSPANQKQEKYWRLVKNTWFWQMSPWSEHNMTHNGDLSQTPFQVAPRTTADLFAIKAAHQSGHVFSGKINIPILDIRHYLEDELDMHHLAASFAIRQRILDVQKQTDLHLIWVTRKPHSPIQEALALLDEWLLMGKNTQDSLSKIKPTTAMDRCYLETGELVATGNDVWDGLWNNKSDGACMQKYPSYLTSRIAAGDSWSGNIFKCQLQPIANAIASGLYQPINMVPYLKQLEKIFPDGVCQY